MSLDVRGIQRSIRVEYGRSIRRNLSSDSPFDTVADRVTGAMRI
jgi:hypothetical protein